MTIHEINAYGKQHGLSYGQAVAALGNEAKIKPKVNKKPKFCVNCNQPLIGAKNTKFCDYECQLKYREKTGGRRRCRSKLIPLK